MWVTPERMTNQRRTREPAVRRRARGARLSPGVFGVSIDGWERGVGGRGRGLLRAMVGFGGLWWWKVLFALRSGGLRSEKCVDPGFPPGNLSGAGHKQ